MKNCKGKAPAFQFYVKDWLSDPELQKAHPTTRGIWINLLCYMWDAPDRGKLETNERELCQLGSCLLEDIKVFLFDAKRLDFCDISVNDIIFIENRRMVRDGKTRKGNRLRKQLQREKGGGDPEKWTAIRVVILQRDEYMCAYCGRKADIVDHIIPRSKGGDEKYSNLVACCRRCNIKKGHRTLEEAKMIYWQGFDITKISTKSHQSHIKVTSKSIPSPTPTPTPTPIATAKPKNKDLKPIVEKTEIPFKEIIEYLNLKTKKRYQYTTPKTQGFIRARWSEGFKSLDDYKHVIDVKCHEWLNTENEKYLRPETLFGTKFEGYLNERIIINSQSPQTPKATTVYQADMLQKEIVNQEYLRQRRQEENGKSNCGHQDVIDIENSPKPIN